MCWMNEWQDGRGTGGECTEGKGPGEMEEGPECTGCSQPRGLCPPPLEPFGSPATSEKTQRVSALDCQLVAMGGAAGGRVWGGVSESRERGVSLEVEVKKPRDSQVPGRVGQMEAKQGAHPQAGFTELR